MNTKILVWLCAAGAATVMAQRQQPQQVQPAQQTQETPGAIAGTVVRGDSGEPVRRAVVTLRRANTFQRGGPQQAGGMSAVSGEDGRFEIKGVSPGQYRVRVNRNGFLTSEYGQRGYGGAGAPVTVQAGQSVSNLTVKLLAAGVIAGTVVNEDGERVSYVTVTAMRATYSQGRMRWWPADSASTNDLGEYRIFDLTPGRYYLSARYSANTGLGFRPDPNAPPEGQGDEGYATQYYPATFDPAEATEVVVGPGAEVRGMDFRLSPVRLVRVRGSVQYTASAPVAEAPGGNRGGMGGPGRGFGARPMVSLIPQSRIILGGQQGRRGAPVDESGRFEIRGVMPGTYTLAAELFDRNTRQSARVPLTVGNTNVENVHVTLAPLPALNGVIRTDAKGTVNLMNLRPRLQGLEGGGGPGGMGPGGGPGTGAVGADGAFTIEGLSLDTYSLVLGGLPETMYIRSIRLGETDVTDAPIDLRNGIAGALTVVLGSGAGVVTGTVTEENRPAEGAMVVLVPDGARRAVNRYYKTSTTDQNGQFTMSGVAPGEYKLFAWDEVEGEMYSDPAFLAKFESKGKTISMKENLRESAELKLLSSRAEQ